jgi:AraC-like DNA-binding protein
MKEENDFLRNKRGYLNNDFEFFHLKDKKGLQFEFHYHDFDKIIIFISGKVTYFIEGKAYRLKPWDILLVSNSQVHKPIIEPGDMYERIVIWVNSSFLEKHNSDECILSSCFELAAENNYNLLRLTPELLGNMRQVLSKLEEACKSKEFGSRILKNSLFMQLIVSLNRIYLGSGNQTEPGDIEYDESIGRILSYINENLNSDLSIENLSEQFFMSKYHLMHKFKKQTGYSIHNYILQKRLIMANMLIKQGRSSAEVSIECGFGDYSSFVRAFKSKFGLSPKKYYKNLLALEDSTGNEKHF